MRRIGFLSVFLFCLSVPGHAQAQDDSLKIGGVQISGSLRTRAEGWNWFDANANNEYGFSESYLRGALSQSLEKWDWKIEFSAPIYLGLPNDAIAPGAQGQLGFGGTYFAANHREQNTASIFARQAYLRFKFNAGGSKQFVQAGRIEFNDGSQGQAKDPTLAALKRDRISQRLIGTFGFSSIGRTFDGLQYGADTGKTNVTLFASRPTRGGFQVNGWGDVNVNVFYGAVTREMGQGRNQGELRVFAVGYDDGRSAVLKTDNRPQAARAGDREGIDIATFGGDYLHRTQTQAGTFDLLLWGVLQRGSWGRQAQRADAFAAEAGWQPPVFKRVKPWLRGGYDYGSGDKNANDGTHGTFFQMLPTGRIYARFPFFNMMNNRDAFGELILRPSKALNIRVDVHSLALANAKDLWYGGSGVFQPWTFGYTGRPSNGHSGLATLYDVSADYKFTPQTSLGAYYGHASGKLVTEAIYPKGQDADFGYLEFGWAF